MTTGALIFAYNNDAFDYVRMAAWSAANIRRHLGIPVAVVTDKPTKLDFDKVIVHECRAPDSRWFGDIQQRAAWNNQSRPDAFDLSPWDRTLLMDADYVVASDRLKLLVNQKHAFLCHRWARDATGQNDFRGLNFFGRFNMPMYWATVIVFDRCQHTRLIFDCMKMIRQHWTHYKNIYQDRSKTYRNDHALSIALNVANGHGNAIDHIPWDLISVMPEHGLQALSPDRYRVDFIRTDNRPAWIELQDQDFHAMGKQSLMSMIS